MANSGAHTEAKATEELLVRNFAEYDYIVASSGSCVHHIRHKFTAADDTPQRRHVSSHIWDLPEFLCDVLKVEEFPWAHFPHTVALHVSCSAIRGLGEQAMSERPHDPWFSKPRSLLEKVDGLTIADFDRHDECCGFGGTFSVTEEAVSAAMGNDKLGYMAASGARYIVSADMSCLMHLQGCAQPRRRGLPVRAPGRDPERRRAMKSVDQARIALEFLEDETHMRAFDTLIWGLRVRRDAAAREVPEWEDLRSLASRIKEHTLAQPRSLPGNVRSQRGAQRRDGALGARRPRAQPDRLRHPQRARSSSTW